MVEEICKRGKHGRSVVLKKKWGLDLKESREGFYQKFRCRGSEDGNGAGTNSEKSGAKNQEADRNNPIENHRVPNSHHLTTYISWLSQIPLSNESAS